MSKPTSQQFKRRLSKIYGLLLKVLMNMPATWKGQTSSELSLSNRTRHKKVMLRNRTMSKRKRKKKKPRNKKLLRPRL